MSLVERLTEKRHADRLHIPTFEVAARWWLNAIADELGKEFQFNSAAKWLRSQAQESDDDE